MKILQINLLPESARLEARYAVWQRVTLRLSVLAAGVIVVAAGALLPSYVLLSFQEAEIKQAAAREEQNPLRGDAERVAQAVAEANSYIRSLRSALNLEQPVNQMAIAILSQVSHGMRLNHIEFQHASRRFVIAGTAESRNDIIELEKRLSSLSLTEDVISPLTNIVRDTNVSFTMQVIVKQ